MQHDNASPRRDPALDVLRETSKCLPEHAVPTSIATAEEVASRGAIKSSSKGNTSSASFDTSSAVDSSSAVANSSAEDAHNSSAVSDLERLRGDELARYDADPVFARDVAHLVGIDPETECGWTVAGSELRVRLWQGEDGLFVFRVFGGWPEPEIVEGEWPAPPGPQALKLAQAFAIATMGTLDVPTGPELSRWKLRLLIELGRETRAPVVLPELPSNATEDARVTWAVVPLLLGIRRLTEPVGEPITFSAPWVARTFAVDVNTIRRGKVWLERHGYLTRVGTCPSGKPNRTVLWRVRESA